MQKWFAITSKLNISFGIRKFKNILNSDDDGIKKCSNTDGAVNICSATLEPNFYVVHCYPDSNSNYSIKKKTNTIYAVTTGIPGDKCLSLFKEISLNL